MNLREIEARANAATMGPWRTPIDVGDPYRAPAIVRDFRDYERPVLDHEGCRVWPWAREEDMEFAYHARQDVPALCALVRDLVCALDEAHDAVDDYVDVRDGDDGHPRPNWAMALQSTINDALAKVTL